MPLSWLCWNCISPIPIVSHSFCLSLFCSPSLQTTKILNIFHSITLPPPTHTHTHTLTLSPAHTNTEHNRPLSSRCFWSIHTCTPIHTHKHPPPPPHTLTYRIPLLWEKKMWELKQKNTRAKMSKKNLKSKNSPWSEMLNIHSVSWHQNTFSWSSTRLPQ